MRVVDKRREVVYGLSVGEARECLALIREEYLQHLHALHEFPDAPVGPNSPGVPLLRKVLPTLPEEMREEWEHVLHDGKVHSQSEILRNIAYRARDDKVRETLLQGFDGLDEHWRAEHPDEPEPGDEYLRRAVAQARRYGADGP